MHNSSCQITKVFSFPLKSLLLFSLLAYGMIADAAKKFEFVVLGDTAYTHDTYEEYEALIDTINREKPAFTIHVGDTLGYQLCNNEMFNRIDGFFKRFKRPLVYTPGDNEWVDCYEHNENGDFVHEWSDRPEYKLDRLAELRKRYFSTDKSLGKRKLTLERQSINEQYADFVENAYWIHNDVLFFTAHIVGSTDSFHPHKLDLIHESVERRHANFWWIMHMLEVAKEHKVEAIVLAAHAEMFERDEAYTDEHDFSGTVIRGGLKGPYAGYVYAISYLTRMFEKPVLLVHGDAHRFVIDRPLKISGHGDEPEKLRLDNLIRLQTYGAPEIKAVKVSVDTKTNAVFGFTPLY